ncbi:MAG: HEAT repeat domain-containing protein [Verrucomicrobiota bacterium]
MPWRLAALSLLAGTSLLLGGCSGPHDDVIGKVKALAEKDQYLAAHKVLEAEIVQAPNAPELMELRLELLLQAAHPALAAEAYQNLEARAELQSDLPVQYLEDGTPEQQLAAIRAMALLGGARWLEPLSAKYGAEDSELRRAVISALGDLRDPAATNLLIRALQDAHWAVRADAAQALGKLRDPKAVIPLFEAMSDEDQSVVLSCGNALLSISKEETAPVDLYAKYVESPRKETRKIALIGLALQQDPRGTAGLIELAQSDNARDQYQAVRALGRSGDAAAIPVVRKALKSTEPAIRLQAVESLGQLRDTASVPALKKIVTSKQEPYELKRQAAVSLLEIVGEDEPAPGTQQVKAK